ncbi:MAG: ABC transporter ATP-binding protein [Bacteriovoracia bacterium]
MLIFQNITKTFKSELLSRPFVALDDVSFEIPSGGMVGFLGANGAGKTTSLKIVMDFIRPDSGSVSFASEMGKSRIDVFKNVGFLPERPYFYPNLTGNEFLQFMGSLSEMNKKSISEAVTRWAPRFKIDHALNRPLRTYSKGMLQRIGFLATILHEPKFIILDEPLSGLDPIGRKELKDVIVEVHRAGKTVFFSSHIVPDIEEICDRVIFLKEGKLIYDGEVEPLLKSDQGMTFTVKYKSPLSPSDLKTPFLGSEDFPGNIKSIKVEEKHKQEILKELISRDIDVTEIELVQPNLEEIFYHIKG